MLLKQNWQIWGAQGEQTSITNAVVSYLVSTRTRSEVLVREVEVFHAKGTNRKRLANDSGANSAEGSAQKEYPPRLIILFDETILRSHYGLKCWE
jgi:hypothetical protein